METKEAIDPVKSLINYLVTVKEHNTPEWMLGLEKKINAAAKHLGDPSRSKFNGVGFDIIRCRRCVECADRSHHWTENTVDIDELSDDTNTHQYVCKHCPTLGDECPVCQGAGEFNGEDDECFCANCNGEGVVEVS